jgi:hypothetical protein
MSGMEIYSNTINSCDDSLPRQSATYTFERKGAVMFRILLIPVLATGLALFFAAQPMAGDQSQPTIAKVYKSPG